MAAAIETPFRYRGSASSYVDIALRGADEHLGIALQYEKHPSSGIGCFIIRFVTHGKEATPTSYTHFTFREDKANFAAPGPDGSFQHAQVFRGIRLNKFAIPVFQPAVQKHELGKYADQFDVWDALSNWVDAQAKAEGFTVTVDLPVILRGLVVPEETPEVEVKVILQFPDFQSPEYQVAAKGQVEKPAPEPVEDEDDEDNDAEEWLQ